MTKKEAILLLDNPPTNAAAMDYSFGKYSGMEKENRIPELKASLDKWTTGKPLHAGKAQSDTSSKALNFPEPLLCILFILRYAITDEQSMGNLKTLLSGDYCPPMQQYKVTDFYTPKWLRTHFVCNVVEIVDTFMGAGTGRVQTNTLPNPENTATRMRMALLHTTTKAFVEVLLKFGNNPKLPNTLDFEDFIQYLKDRSAINKPTTAMEIILDALPQLVQQTITTDFQVAIAGVPKKKHCMTMKWKEESSNIRDIIPRITVDSFNILISANVANGVFTTNRALTIIEYVGNMLAGTISFDEMPKPPIPSPETTTKQSQKTSSGGERGGGGGDTPTKKTKPQLDTTSIETNLQTIMQATQRLNESNSDIGTSIVTAVTTIQSDLEKYKSAIESSNKKAKGNVGSNK